MIFNVSVIVFFVFGLGFAKVMGKVLVNTFHFLDKFFRCRVGSFNFKRDVGTDRHTRMIAVVGVEGRDQRRAVFGIIIGEFSEGEEVEPVVLLIVAENAKILF